MAVAVLSRNVIASVFFALAGAGAAQPGLEDVQREFGIPLFEDENLWDDSADAVAGRLGWGLESRTSSDASFRKYPGDAERVLGCRPYSLALYAEESAPSSLSLMFANKGDSVDLARPGDGAAAERARQSQVRDFKKAVQEDRRVITEKLTRLFGEPAAGSYGQGRQTKELVKRWDWNGHAFLLAAPRDEYVALRIMPTASADAGGRSRISDADLRERIASRIERRENGDVILKDMPMVNQGPKGYCVPATWERVMRYMGVPADMYVLAMAGRTDAGGGTSVADITAGAREAVIRAGRKMDSVALRPEPSAVAKYIDRGLPIMWAMYSTDEFNKAVNERAGQRASVSDPGEWKNILAGARKAARRLRPDRDSAHVCMIVGYNSRTGEIAVSDSWGPAFAERWILPEEASAVTQNSYQVITF